MFWLHNGTGYVILTEHGKGESHEKTDGASAGAGDGAVPDGVQLCDATGGAGPAGRPEAGAAAGPGGYIHHKRGCGAVYPPIWPPAGQFHHKKRGCQQLGWTGGSLEPYAPGCCIGGSRFGNYEGLLPEADGRTWTECDINTLGADSRGAERIVFSNDGLIYYTGDHYKTFELLYGGE